MPPFVMVGEHGLTQKQYNQLYIDELMCFDVFDSLQNHPFHCSTQLQRIHMHAGFIDLYRKIKRDAQIIPLKDIGLVVAETGINGKSKVVDAGSGSGAVACFLANIVKDVTTYEIREDFIEIVKNNIKFLNLKNIKIRNKNIYDGISEKNVDLVVLDLPEPWKALESAEKALKVGGFLVSYSPTITQVSDFVNALRDNNNFAYLKTSEIIERDWEVDGRKVRPRSQAIGHSGFLSFARRI